MDVLKSTLKIFKGKKMSKNTKKRGVTLIELLVVVVILAALAMIAIPRISASSDNAKANACATNVDVINSAIEMYHIDSATGAWPAALTDVTESTTYFPDGAPACPRGGTYTLGSNHRVTCNHS
jgi:general secretion pathway protein G